MLESEATLEAGLTVMISDRWSVGGDDFDTTVRCVIRALSLLAIVMADIVCILLVKL